MVLSRKFKWIASLGLVLFFAVQVALAGPVTVPNTFVSGSPALASEVNANFAAVAASINDNDSRISANAAQISSLTGGSTTPKRTTLTYNQGRQDSTLGTAYELFRTVGQFTKAASDTDVILVWNSHIRVTSLGANFGDFQLRIDGRDTLGSGGTSSSADGRAILWVPDGSAVPVDVYSPVCVMARFEGLTAGSHTVEIWVRSTAASVYENPGNFPRTVHVEESRSN